VRRLSLSAATCVDGTAIRFITVSVRKYP